MKKQITIIATLAFFILFSSCEKFLDEKANKRLSVPENLTDLQAMLDHFQVYNTSDGMSGEPAATEYYYTDVDIATRPEAERQLATWQKADVFLGSSDWLFNYRAIYRSNAVLAILKKIERTPVNAQQWDFIEAQAYFHRAKYYLMTAVVWSPAFEEATANSALGIPLRVDDDFNVTASRATIASTYAAIFNDVKKSIRNLPANAQFLTRPSKAAAYGLAARAFLTARKYEEALLYADSSLMIKSDLLDFNTLTTTAAFPVPDKSIEVLHYSYSGSALLTNTRTKIAPEVVSLFEINDLRRSIFLKDNGNGTFNFKGSYTGGATLFTGIGTDEVLLIRAECFARKNLLSQAMGDVNKLLRARYRRNTYVDKVATDQTTVLTTILLERRKQLLFRGVRWSDIKRLNKENAGIELRRAMNGVNYSLTPNSAGFALPIPYDVIELSGMPQNP